MSFGAIAGITLTIALVLVVGVALMSYVSSLVKNAYQIKVELRADVENAIARMEAEMDRRSKALRKELGDEAGQMRDAVRQDIERRLKDMEDRLQKTTHELQGASRTEKVALVEMQRRLKDLETDLAAVKGELARRAALGRALRDKDRAEAEEQGPAGAAAEAEEPAAEVIAPPAVGSRPSPAPGTGQRVPLEDLNA